MDIKEIELDGVDQIDLAQNRGKWWAVVKAVMNLRVPFVSVMKNVLQYACCSADSGGRAV